ncbi:MAG TPA: hypothetical protein PLK46_06885 [Propioniciclava sp.]|uniref:hypothetical protein n=1 Tax=Propioniciclava sp. TaxID=2038686 RepID=UPI002BA40A36|nr:hypothetical protein [Propioniciclava sp.]HRL49929.1 hypothetical protein [Propioniciclava sp.]HRL80039.1 hypothetical protein [Propioniciclava sp.]
MSRKTVAKTMRQAETQGLPDIGEFIHVDSSVQVDKVVSGFGGCFGSSYSSLELPDDRGDGFGCDATDEHDTDVDADDAAADVVAEFLFVTKARWAQPRHRSCRPVVQNGRVRNMVIAR